MPSFIKLHVIRARGLPTMDRSTGLTDAYVEVRFGQEERRTPVVRRTLQPHWDYKARFEVEDDDELMNEPLVLQVMDKDVITADDIIGFVMLPLEPLLVRREGKDGQELSGWFPIYDTIEGIRGEIEVTVRLQSFGDTWQGGTEAHTTINFFNESTLVQTQYPQQWIIGFVAELLTEDDPEFDWSDSFRSSRKSNQSRQLLLHRMAHALRSRIAKKVTDIGGNAVVGYRQCFDFEGDSGIVSRAYGTAAYIVHTNEIEKPAVVKQTEAETQDDGAGAQTEEESKVDRERTVKFCWHPYIAKVLQAYRSSANEASETDVYGSSSKRRSFQLDASPGGEFTPGNYNTSPTLSSRSKKIQRSTSEDYYSTVSSLPARKKPTERYVEFTKHIFGETVVPLHPTVKPPRQHKPTQSKQGSSVSSPVPANDDLPREKSAAGEGSATHSTDRFQGSIQIPDGSVKYNFRKKSPRPLLAVDPLGELEMVGLNRKGWVMGIPPVMIHETVAELEHLMGIPQCTEFSDFAWPSSESPQVYLLSDSSNSISQQKSVFLKDQRPLGRFWERTDFREDEFRAATRQRHNFRKGAHRRDDVQIFSTNRLPLYSRCNVGGLIAARSVKYLGRLHADVYDRDRRDQWWTELRDELKQHALRLRCSQILGYEESVIISEDVAILSITGTAVRLRNLRQKEWDLVCSERRDCLLKRSQKCAELLNELDANHVTSQCSNIPVGEPPLPFGRYNSKHGACSCLHLPFHHRHAVFHNVRVVRCGMCNHGWVPETLLATVEPPSWLPITGNQQCVEAHAVRSKEKSGGEQDCVAVSKELLFIEYEAHQQFVMKLKIHGFNAAFNVQSHLGLSKNHLVLTVTGTGVLLDALPVPPVMRIKRPHSSLLTERGLWHAYLWELGLNQGIRSAEGEVTLDKCVENLSAWHSASMTLALRKKEQLLQELLRHDGSVAHHVAELVKRYHEKYGHFMESISPSKKSASKQFIGNVDKLSLASSTTVTSNEDSTIDDGSDETSSSSSAESSRSSDSSESESDAPASDGDGSSVESVSDDDLEERYKDKKKQYIFNVDDEHDENVLTSVLDRRLPAGVTTSTLHDCVQIRPFLLGGLQVPTLHSMKKIATHRLGSRSSDGSGELSSNGQLAEEQTAERVTSVTGPLYRLIRKLSPRHRLVSVRAALENAVAIGSGCEESQHDDAPPEVYQLRKRASAMRNNPRLLIIIMRFNWSQTIMEIASKASLQTGKRYDAAPSFSAPKATEETDDNGSASANVSTGMWSQLTSHMKKVRFTRKQKQRNDEIEETVTDTDQGSSGEGGSAISDASRSEFQVNETDALNMMYQTALSKLCYQAKNNIPCSLSGIESSVDLPDSHTVEIKMTATLVPSVNPWINFEADEGNALPVERLSTQPSLQSGLSWFFVGYDDVWGKLNSTSNSALGDTLARGKAPPCLLPPALERLYGDRVTHSNTSIYEEGVASIEGALRETNLGTGQRRPEYMKDSSIMMVSVGSLPGMYVKYHLGRINMHFVRESIDVKPSEDGLSRFDYSLVQEVHAYVRAYIAALGGNALLHYSLTCQSNPGSVARNSAYRVVSVSGDVAELVAERDCGYGYYDGSASGYPVVATDFEAQNDKQGKGKPPSPASRYSSEDRGMFDSL
eukprot:gb/GECG01011518.1/.p1 GENE.gb/GECG01011518.1/~~gb/GECG01011518.1/.p1  ORF type:complete len:1646 (+),score=234.79 gb/GECG01011518.1/:1-4938(+)